MKILETILTGMIVLLASMGAWATGILLAIMAGQ